MNGTLQLIGSCVFVPTQTPAPVTSASMYNTNGNDISEPMPYRYGAGEYEFHIPEDLDVQNISINARAYNAAGDSRLVSVKPTVLGGSNTAFDVVIRDSAGAATDDASLVEITVSRLPLA